MKTTHGAAARTDDEPKTPLWLPALGVAFFVLLAVIWEALPEQAGGAVAPAGPAASAAPPTGGARPSPPPLPPGHP
jgi:hypothetical protein